MLRNIVTSLFKYEQIETTDAKAKSLKPIAEKMITLAKRGDLHARRQALSYLQDKTVTHKLFDELKDRYLDRQGGYVRIVKKGIRRGDAAPISIVQLIPEGEEKKSVKKKTKKNKKTKAVTPKPQSKVAVKKKDEVAETSQDEEAPEIIDETASEIEKEKAETEEVKEQPPVEETESQEEDTENSENEEDKQA
jgi:large subunit ribosomal protein L17